tara:strand:- start:932 stop:2266 length:1335 start_codon:yes stop_codon:yes gene_type:complete
MEILLGIMLLLALLVIIIQFVFFKRAAGDGTTGSLDSLEVALQRVFLEEAQRSREADDKAARELRAEIRDTLAVTQESLTDQVVKLGAAQQGGLEKLSQDTQRLLGDTQKRLAEIHQAIATQMATLQAGNEKKLEEMRQTVDEKLQKTLQTRLSESFQLVSKHLQEVQQGLGEMRSLAENVGGLQRVLSNVKTRGTWGEIQLEAILQDLLVADQYEQNVETVPGTNSRVEFAVKMPGHGTGDVVWLPIDSKFPQEDWMRLQDAIEKGDVAGKEGAERGLRQAVVKSASDIREKYVSPPHTIDYGIMFLPTEGLYGEVLRLPGLDAELRQKYRVVPAGPTTLAAILSSIRLGFRALAIERRSAEIWDVLAAVKEEFGKFEGVIGQLEKQLSTAQNTVSKMGTRSRQMKRKMQDVQELPEGSDSAALLGLPESIEDQVPDEQSEID